MGRRKRWKRAEEARSDGGGSPPAARRGPRKGDAILWAIAVLVLGITVGLLLLGRGGDDSPAGLRTAAIVDQLSLTQPNASFVASARNTLEQGGYAVDYYPGEQVTVEFYRELPRRGYDLILLRVHSARAKRDGTITGDLMLFTGEPYSDAKYVEEQRARRLGIARYYEGGDPLFGILPDFVADSMEGRFDGTLILAMGCDGLRSLPTAQTFLDKGASAFVSWSRPVSASHTDAATERLLEKLLLEGLTTVDAVSQTAAAVGPDPFYGAELRVMIDEG